MRRQDDTINKLKDKNKYLSQEIKGPYINTYTSIKKENTDLKTALNDEKLKDKELHALRELMFSIEQIDLTNNKKLFIMLLATISRWIIVYL